MDRPAVLSLSRVDKSYGRLRALSEVSLKIAAGEFAVLLGTAGAGRSTLIHLVAGLFTPDAGRIAILGKDLRHDPVAARRAIGFVFEDLALDPDQTIGGNLDYHADLYGIDRRAGRAFARQLLELLGVAGVTADKARSLSVVNRRRVELAQAMLHQPAIVVADDIGTGLDPRSRRDLLADLERARPAETALLWATDDPDDAAGADHVVVLDRGHVIFDGSPLTLVSEQGTADLRSAFSRLTSHGEARV